LVIIIFIIFCELIFVALAGNMVCVLLMRSLIFVMFVVLGFAGIIIFAMVSGGWWRPRHDRRGDRRGDLAQGVADVSLNDTLSDSLSDSLSDTKNGWNPRLSNKVPEKRVAISLHVW
jgi:hypothetical protein